MSGRFIKQTLQYVISLAVAIVVLWYVLRDVQLEEMRDSLADVDYGWILLSIFFGLIGYFLRAWRWNLLLAPLNHKPAVQRTFMALMAGYLANLALPRLGEFVRCGILKKTDEVPVSTALGTVVTERVIDFIFLLLIVLGTLLLEIDRLEGLLAELFTDGSRLPASSLLIYLLLALLLLAGLAWWLFKTYQRRLEENALYQKVLNFLRELLQGVLSVRKVKNPAGFWLSTVGIWMMYYLMSYVIVFSLPQTAGIDLRAGLSILAMGGIGMAAPVQGGLGTYHLLVSSVLMVYGAARNEAVLLAFILHTSQTVFVIITGAVSLLGIFLIGRKKKPEHTKA